MASIFPLRTADPVQHKPQRAALMTKELPLEPRLGPCSSRSPVLTDNTFNFRVNLLQKVARRSTGLENDMSVGIRDAFREERVRLFRRGDSILALREYSCS